MYVPRWLRQSLHPPIFGPYLLRNFQKNVRKSSFLDRRLRSPSLLTELYTPLPTAHIYPAKSISGSGVSCRPLNQTILLNGKFPISFFLKWNFLSDEKIPIQSENCFYIIRFKILCVFWNRNSNLTTFDDEGGR